MDNCCHCHSKHGRGQLDAEEGVSSLEPSHVAGGRHYDLQGFVNVLWWSKWKHNLRGTLLEDQHFKRWPCQITCPAIRYPWAKSCFTPGPRPSVRTKWGGQSQYSFFNSPDHFAFGPSCLLILQYNVFHCQFWTSIWYYAHPKLEVWEVLKFWSFTHVYDARIPFA